MYLHISRPHLISTAELDILLRAPYQAILDLSISLTCTDPWVKDLSIRPNAENITKNTATMATQPMISYATVDGTQPSTFSSQTLRPLTNTTQMSPRSWQ